METQKNHLPQMPYFEPKKLEDIEKHLTQTIKANEKDFRKITSYGKFKTALKNPFKSTDLLSYYQNAKKVVLLELHSIVGNFNTALHEFKNVRFDYLDLVSLKEDKSWQEFKEREALKERIQSHEFFIENQSVIASGTESHREILKSEMELHQHQANHIVSKQKVLTASNQTLEVELESMRNKEIQHKASENGILAWEEYQKQKASWDSQKTDQNLVPATENQTTDSFVSYVTKNKENDTIKEEKPNSKHKQPREEFKPFPIIFDDRITINRNNTNSPSYLKGELDLLTSMAIFGTQYCQCHFPKESPEAEIKLGNEKVSDKDLNIPNTLTNILAGASLTKCLFYGLTTIAGMLSEMIVFETVLGNIFHLTGAKKYCIAFVALVIAKTFGFSFYNVIKTFISKKNILNWKAVRSSKFFYILIVCLICYTTILGFVYFSELEHKRKVEEYSEIKIGVQNKKAELEINPNAVSQTDKNQLREDQQKVAKLQKEVFTESKFVTFLKGLLISLSSGLILLANCVLLTFTILLFKSYLLKCKLNKLSKSLIKLQANYDYRMSLIQTMNHKAYYIVSLIGQRFFIRSLKKGGAPIGSHFSKSDEDEQVNAQLPLNEQPITK